MAARSYTGAVTARVVMHVDLDAFYASVEELLQPALRGKPVIVGGVPGSRGVVMAASYAARRYGVRSAMPLVQAQRLCPQGIFLPTNFDAYRRYSAQVFAVLRDYSPVIEPIALDEAYLDLTGSALLLGPPQQVAEEVRDRVDREVRLPISIGVGSSKLIAKIASGLQKPRGLVIVPPGDEAAFVQRLALRQLPGLGPALAVRLDNLGIRTVAVLAAAARDYLESHLGSTGAMLHDFAHGVDSRPVVNPGLPKSISRETTFERDIRDAALLAQTLRQLTQDVGTALRHERLVARTVALKLRYRPFQTVTRQATLIEASDQDTALVQAATALLRRHHDSRRLVRLLGVGVHNLETVAQLELFARRPTGAPELDRSLDALRERYGDQAITRGPRSELAQRDFRRRDLDIVRGLTPGGDRAP
jgi:DNA polymerase-4